MGPDARAHVIDHHVGEALLLHHRRHALRILDAVSVKHADHALLPVGIRLQRRLHPGDKRLQRFLASSHSSVRLKLSLRRHSQDRFDIHKASHDSRRFRHSSAALQVIEVIDREQDIDMLGRIDLPIKAL